MLHILYTGFLQNKLEKRKHSDNHKEEKNTCIVLCVYLLKRKSALGRVSWVGWTGAVADGRGPGMEIFLSLEVLVQWSAMGGVVTGHGGTVQLSPLLGDAPPARGRAQLWPLVRVLASRRSVEELGAVAGSSTSLILEGSEALATFMQPQSPAWSTGRRGDRGAGAAGLPAHYPLCSLNTLLASAQSPACQPPRLTPPAGLHGEGDPAELTGSSPRAADGLEGTPQVLRRQQAQPLWQLPSIRFL